ncbi:hypothetical protein E3P84_00814 [Wallemia ichthyophaga]|nr:hypothetical protein E3P84_00814 [Wallemia ichthyophaga]
MLQLMTQSTPKILSIAGSDSGGGAGIQADIKTFTALHCYGMSALTALTSQNTLGVHQVHAVPVDFITSQIRHVITDLGVDALKTGMLYGKEVIEGVVDTLQELSVRAPLVVDPVMVSTSGHRLLNQDALTALQGKLLPKTTLCTPNIPEAELLTGRSIASVRDMLSAATRLNSVNTLVKGGHLTFSVDEVQRAIAEVRRGDFGDVGDVTNPTNVTVHGETFAAAATNNDSTNTATAYVLDTYAQLRGNPSTQGTHKSGEERLVVDILYQRPQGHLDIFIHPFVSSTSTHGTGCTLSAALAAYLGGSRSGSSRDTSACTRMTMAEAVQAALTYTRLGIEHSEGLGAGNGPLNHMHSMHRGTHITTPLTPRTTRQPTPLTTHLITTAGVWWDTYIAHPFVHQLATGTLPSSSFRHYIAQDYIYLLHYARIHSLAGYKSRSMGDLEAFARITSQIVQESAMHRDYCREWGVDEKTLMSTPESAQNIAYTRYLADVGHSGSLLDLVVAVASCLLGYGEIGRRLKTSANTGCPISPGVVCIKDNNPYWKWIEDYASDDFQAAVFDGIDMLERMAEEDHLGADHLAHLSNIFTTCCKLECGFWDMGLHRL